MAESPKNTRKRGAAGRRKAPTRKSPAVNPAEEASYVLELIEVHFREPVNLRPAVGQRREQAGFLTAVEGNKHGVTRLWCDGVFVHIVSERFLRRAVPLTNVVDVETAPVRLPAPRQAEGHPRGDSDHGPATDDAPPMSAFTPQPDAGTQVGGEA